MTHHSPIVQEKGEAGLLCGSVTSEEFAVISPFLSRWERRIVYNPPTSSVLAS